jgi:tRNA dimethylallyltransferase
VPHHLLDLVEPDESFSLAMYLQAARAAEADVLSRGRTPLFVGGTPLYLKALLRGIFEGPPADWPFRRELLALAESQGAQVLHDRLAAVDPAAASRLPPGDLRRIVRAIEVYEKTGRPMSDWQQQFDRTRPAEDLRVFVLSRPREELNARIDRRVEAMFAAGLVAEVRNLLAAGKSVGPTAGQALGYREVLEHLRGERDLSATVQLVQTRSRQFAKRQRTWFRSLSECREVAAEADDDARSIADRIAEAGGGG